MPPSNEHKPSEGTDKSRFLEHLAVMVAAGTVDESSARYLDSAFDRLKGSAAHEAQAG
jgi:hypothetical protein